MTRTPKHKRVDRKPAAPQDVASSLPRSPHLPALRAGASVAVALGLLTCYWLTLGPTITEGDSGQLAAAVHTMGVAHPTGYPLYLMVGKLFDLLPMGEPAHRIAFSSAVCAAVGAGLLCWALISLTLSVPAGLLGGLALGFNTWVWSQANIVEVYALNLLLVCLALVMFVRWSGEPTPRRLSLLAFVSGLALTHHRTSVFFVAPMLLWAVAATRPLSARVIGRAALFAFLPLLLYLWLPWRSAHHPPANWGNTSGSLRYFLEHISGAVYAVYAFRDSAANAWAAIASAAVRLREQVGVIGVGLALVGVVGMVGSRRDRALGIPLIISFIGASVWAAFYLVPDKDVFFMPAIIVLCAWCGAGLAYLLHGARGMRVSPAIQRVMPAAAVAVGVVLPLNVCVGNWKPMNRSQDYVTLDDTAAAVAVAPANAIFLVVGDEVYGGLLYYCHVLNPGSSRLVLPLTMSSMRWRESQLEPPIRKAYVEARTVPGEHRRGYFVYAVRERVDPRRPIYTNYPLEDAPPGFALVIDYPLGSDCPDYPLDSLQLPPVFRQAPDAGGARTLLDFCGGAGGLLGITAPARASRGRPFSVTAAIRWTGAGRPDCVLAFTFDHAVAGYLAKVNPRLALTRLRLVRPLPVLFGVAAPGNREGWHYRQSFSVVLPHSLMPGPYRIFAQLAEGETLTPPVPVGAITVL